MVLDRGETSICSLAIKDKPKVVYILRDLLVHENLQLISELLKQQKYGQIIGDKDFKPVASS